MDQFREPHGIDEKPKYLSASLFYPDLEVTTDNSVVHKMLLTHTHTSTHTCMYVLKVWHYNIRYSAMLSCPDLPYSLTGTQYSTAIL